MPHRDDPQDPWDEDSWNRLYRPRHADACWPVAYVDEDRPRPFPFGFQPPRRSGMVRPPSRQARAAMRRGAQ